MTPTTMNPGDAPTSSGVREIAIVAASLPSSGLRSVEGACAFSAPKTASDLWANRIQRRFGLHPACAKTIASLMGIGGRDD